MRTVPSNIFKPSSKCFTDRSKSLLLLCIFFLFVCVCQTVLYVPCSLVVICRERAEFLAFMHMMFYCVLSLFLWCPGLGVVFIVSIPDVYFLPYHPE